jgi:putative heme transporter
MTQTETAGKSKPSRTRRIIQSAISLILVAAILWFVLKGTDFVQVWAEIGAMTWIEMVTLGVIALWNLVTYQLVWMTCTPGLKFGQALTLTLASTAVGNTLPAGAAVGVGVTYEMLRSWGFSRSRITIPVLVSGVWNSFTKLGLPVLALALVALQGNASPGRITAALAGIAGLIVAVAVFAAMLRSEKVAAQLGITAGRAWSWVLKLFGKPPAHGWEIATTRFRSRTVGLVNSRWVVITAVTVISHLSLWLVLLVTLRHVGVSDAAVGWAEVLAVFAFARLATAIPFTPGGLGVVEAVLISGLVAAGGDRSKVVAAVLVYRALTWLLPVPLGVIAYLRWRRTSWTAPAPGQVAEAP